MFLDEAQLAALIRAATKRGSPVPLGAQLRIFLDALAGLHAAHELTDGKGELLSLVHRDVSPQNILVGSDGIARITDFGVARARSRITTTKGHELKGKMSYLAPEQVLSEPIDRRADVYSAGVMLWGLLTGRRMIRGDNDGAIVAQILAPKRPSPRALNPAVPPRARRDLPRGDRPRSGGAAGDRGGVWRGDRVRRGARRGRDRAVTRGRRAGERAGGARGARRFPGLEDPDVVVERAHSRGDFSGGRRRSVELDAGRGRRPDRVSNDAPDAHPGSD